MKKILSLVLALAVVLSLAPAVMAADTLTGNQLYPAGDWGDGPSLTLTGVVNGVATEIDPSYLYDVEVGGSLVLEMPYPAGKNRSYDIMIGGFYIAPDFGPTDNNETWQLPAASQGGDFDENSGVTRYVYTFTEADMGQKNGLDKIIYPDIFWCDDANGDGQTEEGSYGSVYFGIRVVPAKSQNIAYASTQTVDVGGVPVEFQMYALKDEKGNPTNYIKLRDLAFAIGQTQAGFEVGWNGAVQIDTTKTYTINGSEMSTPFSGDRPYQKTIAATYVNGKPVQLDAFTLQDDKGGAYTYYQLRDLGRTLGFNVGWSAERGIYIEPDVPYQE